MKRTLNTTINRSKSERDYEFHLNGPKWFVAHSLGNMLVSAAIQDYGMQHEKYFMLNAAVAMEAFDPATGFCTVKTYADGSTRSAYTRTPDGFLLRETKPSGAWKENVYDAARQIVGVVSSDGAQDASMQRDEFGRVMTESNSVAFAEYSLDDCWGATNETQTVDGFSVSFKREFDAYGRIERFARIGGEESMFGYAPHGAISTVSNGNVVVEYAFTGDVLDAGYALAVQRGADFSREVFQHDYLRNCIVAVSNHCGNVSQGLEYSYDALQRPIARNLDSFAYNDRGEVIFSRRGAENAEETYSYDDIGNLVSNSLADITNAYVSNNRNQYMSINETSALSAFSRETSYDLDGNMTRHGEWTYAYDSGNRLVFVASNGITVASMSYDTQGRRVKKVAADGTHRYFYDGWLLVYEHVVLPNNTTNEIEYVWGKDISGTRDGAAGIGGLLYLTVSNSSTPNSSTQQLYIPWYDAYGNILGYRDAQGNVVASYTYDAFGNIIGQSGPMAGAFAFRYSTKYLDSENGLYYYGYRYYKPQIMRWLTEDPIGDDGGLNLYAMCENDTVLYHDALGEARMITGSLFALKGTKRIIFSGYNHARNIIRLVDKLNNIYVAGQKVYDAKICDLVTTPVSSLKKGIAVNANNVYIIAHGGLVINNKVFRGRHYLWNESDSVDERIFPTGKPPGIDVHSLGVNMDNVFGCYISAAVRKVPSRTLWRTQYTSSVDDYGRMYEALYSRLARYAVNPQPSKCPVRIRIFEGENANESNKSYAETENALRKHPIRDEEEYK